MILEGVDRTFGGVAAMGIWWDKLEVDIVFAEGILHSAGAFFVAGVGDGRSGAYEGGFDFGSGIHLHCQ